MKNFPRDIFALAEVCALLAPAAAKMNFIVWDSFSRRKVSWFDLETCTKVIVDDAVGQKIYDFLFYGPFGFTASALQSILCRNDLAG